MTPEEWLAENTGYCSRLHARITPEQCAANRDSQLIFSCNGCGGLDMEKKFKGNHKACTVPGCDKQQWKGGMCYKHFHQQTVVPNNAEQDSTNVEGVREHVAPEPPAGLLTLLPIVEDEKHGFFLDFGERLTELRILKKNGVTADQIVDTLCLIAGGGYELRRVGR